MDFQEFASNSFGNDIDVYLQPIMEELKELWGFGGKTYDPALAMLSRRSTKRQLELPRKKTQPAKTMEESCGLNEVGLELHYWNWEFNPAVVPGIGYAVHVLPMQTAADYMYLSHSPSQFLYVEIGIPPKVHLEAAAQIRFKEITLAFSMDFEEDETIDKSWLELPRNHLDYEAGVKNFMKFGCRDLELGEEIWCPCRKCNNKNLLKPSKAEAHIMWKRTCST
ncbi:hypothetical protein C5167_031823 [Papaver somniferum]|uniref:Transposase-associated domain-containing protein n=1 Tax=Papaver somniferum TaxID=3469 RepID=A0A4Y7K9C4_PAPSO|nr:hypothetical protein C5167_031823 [Papaver somniferum]